MNMKKVTNIVLQLTTRHFYYITEVGLRKIISEGGKLKGGFVVFFHGESILFG